MRCGDVTINGEKLHEYQWNEENGLYVMNVEGHGCSIPVSRCIFNVSLLVDEVEKGIRGGWETWS